MRLATGGRGRGVRGRGGTDGGGGKRGERGGGDVLSCVTFMVLAMSFRDAMCYDGV